MEEYEKKHDHAVTEKETDIPKLTDLLLKVGTQQFLETLSPYITGGEILFDGEDGQTWKFTFDPENKSWQQKCGTESFTDQMMIHELEQKGYDVYDLSNCPIPDYPNCLETAQSCVHNSSF